MQGVEDVFLVEFWRSANAEFSGPNARALEYVQKMFIKAVLSALSFEPGPPRNQETGFRILHNVLSNMRVPALRAFAQDYLRQQRIRPPSPEIPVHDGNGDDYNFPSLHLSQPPHRPMDPFGGFGEEPASIPDYFDADQRELDARRASQRRREEMDAIYLRTYEELEREKQREREEWLEEQRRLRRGRRNRPETPPPPVGGGGDDVIASVPAFQANMWAQDGNLLKKLAVQPEARMEAIVNSPFLHQITNFAINAYKK